MVAYCPRAERPAQNESSRPPAHGRPANANAKAVQHAPGHKPAIMTLDAHARLSRVKLDTVAQALDYAERSTDVGKVWAADVRETTEPPASPEITGL